VTTVTVPPGVRREADGGGWLATGPHALTRMSSAIVTPSTLPVRRSTGRAVSGRGPDPFSPPLLGRQAWLLSVAGDVFLAFRSAGKVTVLSDEEIEAWRLVQDVPRLWQHLHRYAP
jgi:hypothetical protein